MEMFCYVCNNRTKDWQENLAEVKSKHSGTPITVFIEKFLDDFVSLRDINDAKNCVCSNCLSRIYSYDWMCMKVKEQEKEFHMLLMATEKNYLNNQIKIEDCAETKVNLKNGRTNSGDRNIDVKPTVSGSDNVPGENVKRSKPIIVRVVKRVPFLKSKPPDSATIKPTTTTFKPPIPLRSTVPSTGKPIATANERIPVSGDGPSISNAKQVLSPKKKIKIYVCKFCEEKFRNLQTLKNHVKCHTKSTGMITCHICLYQMSDSDMDEFKNHVKKHAKATPKQCVICDEGGLVNFDLRYHVQKHHTAANLLCETCGKSFVFASALSKHRMSHIEDRPEQCQYCEKAFKFKRALKEHMVTHVQTEPEFACAFCDKKFKRRDHCRTHERRHRGDTKKNKCSICPAAFESKHDLNLHLQRKHDAEKPHDKTRR